MPARTSITVIDMNRFQLGRAGGGNVGFALAAPTVVKIAVTSMTSQRVECKWKDERANLIPHVVSRWNSLVTSMCGYRVDVLRSNPPHTGFASSAGIQIAVWCGLNHLFGYLNSERDLRKVMAENYREATLEGTSTGFTTGLSSFLGLYGGYAAVDEKLLPIHSAEMPPWSAAIVVPSRLVSVSHGQIEVSALTNQGPSLDEYAHSEKRRIIRDVLTPAILGSDIVTVGEAVDNLQSIGSKRSEKAIYGTVIENVITDLRREFSCVFMSAVGPGIAILSELPCEKLSARIDSFDVDKTWIGDVDSNGLSISSQHIWEHNA